MVLTSWLYFADCISYKSLLNPHQTQYRVKVSEKPELYKGRNVKPPYGSLSDRVSLRKNLNRTETPPDKQETDFPETTEPRPEMARPMSRDLKDVKEGFKPPVTSVGTAQFQRGSSDRDALDEAIEEAKATQTLVSTHLPTQSVRFLMQPQPLDEDDTETEGGDDGTIFRSDVTETDKPPPKKSKTLKGNSWQDKFSCMTKHDGLTNDDNPNAHTIEILQQMADYYERTQDHWRIIAYRKAIATLRQQETKIMFKDQARALPFVGDRLADKIEEIVRTNRLRRLESTTLDPNDKALKTFLNVYGVGYKQACLFISQGHRTLEDLLTKAKLTKNQRIGVEHYVDFLSPIPRKEVEAHGAFVEGVMEEVFPKLKFTIGGSYRRGAQSSGDVDFIVTAANTSVTELRTLAIEIVVPRLFELGYLQAGLAVTSADTGSKWHGAASLPNYSRSMWRRVDFLLVPSSEWGAALIYFTGNDIFNRSIRLLASKKGMRLNQRGLWKDVIRGPQRQRITQGSLVESESEERIFELLGVPWRPPEHRIC